MLQLDHRNASFVHSHIAVLQFAFFSFANRIVFSPHPEGAVNGFRKPKQNALQISMPSRSGFDGSCQKA